VWKSYARGAEQDSNPAKKYLHNDWELFGSHAIFLV
jgi:hypothetical protein